MTFSPLAQHGASTCAHLPHWTAVVFLLTSTCGEPSLATPLCTLPLWPHSHRIAQPTEFSPGRPDRSGPRGVVSTPDTHKAPSPNLSKTPQDIKLQFSKSDWELKTGLYQFNCQPNKLPFFEFCCIFEAVFHLQKAPAASSRLVFNYLLVCFCKRKAINLMTSN